MYILRATGEDYFQTHSDHSVTRVVQVATVNIPPKTKKRQMCLS